VNPISCIANRLWEFDQIYYAGARGDKPIRFWGQKAIRDSPVIITVIVLLIVIITWACHTYLCLNQHL